MNIQSAKTAAYPVTSTANSAYAAAHSALVAAHSAKVAAPPAKVAAGKDINELLARLIDCQTSLTTLLALQLESTPKT